MPQASAAYAASDGRVPQSVASNPQATAEGAEAEFFAGARSASLLQRMIEPEEIANMIAFLASPLSSATNGAAIRVEVA